eukprot:TRINITY_DN48898_c0_g1_i1.p1 TRINITY_DN48898_c0_g1~~TRINITY_DN48898_c0_g1_i1.p1  ORF type:complete len:647 (-),score=91.12 TRINITY_DN48898_c0_g1_i1:83-2002(-)
MAGNRFLGGADNPRVVRQIFVGFAAVVAAKLILDLSHIVRVAHATFGKDTKLPQKKRVNRRERDETLKRGPKALAAFLVDGQRPDVIIVGSGIGGLTCGAILGRTGLRVLVLEQHDVAGGCLHSYTAGGFEWDVGIHYVGEVGGPGIHRALLDQVGRGQIEWKHLKDPYDTTYIPPSVEEGLLGNFDAFQICRGTTVNEEMLCQRFPDEQVAIKKFFRDVRRQAAGALVVIPKALPKWLGLVFGKTVDLFTGFYSRMGMSVAAALSQLGIQNNQLKGVLSYPWGDLGTPPASLSYGMLLGLHAHFMKEGAYFPVGGASYIAHALVETIRDQGGDVLVRCPVSKIMMKGKRVSGVSLSSGKDVILASGGHVVCAVSLATLYDKLLPLEHIPKIPRCVQDNGYMREGCAAMSLFVGLESSGADLQLDSIQGSAWAYRSPNFDEDWGRFMAQTPEDVLAKKVQWPMVFLGFPSSKDPAWSEDFPNKTSITVISLVSWAWFAEYENSRVHKRGARYDALKDCIAQQMWSFVCELHPQLAKAKIGHFEAGSPLSNNYYIGSNKGEIYGADHTSKRFKLDSLIAARPSFPGIPGLLVAGQENMCGGFAGGLFGGSMAAGELLGSPLGLWAGMLYSGFRNVPHFSP